MKKTVPTLGAKLSNEEKRGLEKSPSDGILGRAINPKLTKIGKI